MPGSLVLEGNLDLTETEVPGVGDTVTVKLRNTGTIDLSYVSIAPEGDGARHIQLSTTKTQWANPGQELKISALRKGTTVDIYVRGIYSEGDAEDREKVKLVASALSVG